MVISDRVNGCSRIRSSNGPGKFIRALGNLHGLRMALSTTTAGLTVSNGQVRFAFEAAFLPGRRCMFLCSASVID